MATGWTAAVGAGLVVVFVGEVVFYVGAAVDERGVVRSHVLRVAVVPVGGWGPIVVEVGVPAETSVAVAGGDAHGIWLWYRAWRRGVCILVDVGGVWLHW